MLVIGHVGLIVLVSGGRDWVRVDEGEEGVASCDWDGLRMSGLLHIIQKRT